MTKKDIEVVPNPNTDDEGDDDRYQEDRERDRFDSIKGSQYDLRRVLLETTNTL